MSDPKGSRRTAADARILEIGDHYYFKAEHPERTTLLWTGRVPPIALDRALYEECTPRRLWRELRAARDGAYDLIVAYGTPRSPFHPRYWLRSLARTPLHPIEGLTRVFGVWLLRFARPTIPLVAIDMHDDFRVGSHCFFLLDRAQHYFKRELPVDHWHVLHGSAHPTLPTLRVRRSRRWQQRIAKLRPLAIGVHKLKVDFAGRDFPEKTSDIFFAGAVEANSTVRPSGLAELKALASRGLKLDLPESRLPQAEFYRRMTSAWLTWSPAGLGWDCHRHYEAAQCLTVPLINYPTIVRYAPLEEGKHAIYYAPEPGGLTRAVLAALSNRDRLRDAAIAAREHVLAHHTHRARCDAVLEAVFGRP